MEETINARLKLENPYPSWPHRAKHEIWARTESGRFTARLFSANYSAKAFVEFIIDSRKYRWINDDEIELDNGTRITSKSPGSLEEVIEHKLTKGEQQWQLPYHHERDYLQFIGRIKPTSTSTNTPDTPQRGSKRKARSASETSRPEPKRKSKSSSTAEKSKTSSSSRKKADPSLITPAHLATELKTDAKKIRGALRKLNISKPYEWTKEQADELKPRIAKNLR